MRSLLASAALAALVISSPALGARETRVQQSRTTTATAPKAATPKKTTTAKAPRKQAKAPAAAQPPVANQPVAKGTYLAGCDAALLNANACRGYYEGNILNGSPTDIPIQQAAVAALPGDLTFDGNWNALGAAVTTLSGPNNNQINFGVPLLGETIIGIHFGNVAGDAGNVTGFYYFNFAEATNFITLNNTQGFSNAVLYATNGMNGAVPEPTTWAMMLLGFGGMGVALRRRRRTAPLMLQIA